VLLFIHFFEGGSPDKPNPQEYNSIIDEAKAFFGIH
jgi:hypothetical protein